MEANNNPENIQPSKAIEHTTKTTDDTTTNGGELSNNHVDSITNYNDEDAEKSDNNDEPAENTTSVEQRLRNISEEVGRINLNGGNPESYERQSFLSLNDLMKSLRSSDRRHPPQIDSDYSNTMHVLGERASIVNADSSRKIKTIDLRQTNRALY